MIVLGVDPGGSHTGVVVAGVTPVPHVVLRWDGGDFDEYLAETLDQLTEMAATHRPDVIAVEDLVHPNPHLGFANLTGLLGAAQVLGAVRTWARGWVAPLVLVRPGQHGAGPKQAYPSELWGEREKRGTGRLRHCRSAWDVARSVGMVR